MSTSTTRVRSRLAASVVALTFLGLTTACGEQSAQDQPAVRPAPRAQPTVHVIPGPPPAIRNGSEPSHTSEPSRIKLRRVAQHETHYHGSLGRP